ncbi:hypothetical protein NN561_005603 [Cricetulus griseus]
MANNASLEQNQNPCSAINNSIPLIQGKLPTLTLSGKIRVAVTFFLFLLSTAFNASFLSKLQKWTQKKEKGRKLSRMKVLLKHLTLANLLETLIVMPLDGMWNITVQWYAGEFLCKVLSYLKLFSMYAPAFMMVVISLDRSLAITRPLAVQSNSKLEQSMIGLAWILSIVFAGPQPEVTYHFSGSVPCSPLSAQSPSLSHAPHLQGSSPSCPTSTGSQVSQGLTGNAVQGALPSSASGDVDARPLTLAAPPPFCLPGCCGVSEGDEEVRAVGCSSPGRGVLLLVGRLQVRGLARAGWAERSGGTWTRALVLLPDVSERAEATGPRGAPGNDASKKIPTMSTESVEIDDGLYSSYLEIVHIAEVLVLNLSRQRYVLGDTAMQKMAKSHVFLSGMGGLGVEIELNPYVHVSSSSAPFDETTDLSFLEKYQCIVLTEMKLTLQKKINDFCHSRCPSIKVGCGAIGCEMLKNFALLGVGTGREKGMVVQTDETARKPDNVPISSEDERNAVFLLEKAISSNRATKSDLQMAVLSFEKDDDNNGHIDFITAASNLRAKMYSIEPADRFKTKRIAGKIIPAIATSTAAVSGLVALEMIKVAGGYPFEAYKNCFLNLAIPIIVFTETSEVRKTEIRDGISFTIWDRWTVHGNEDFTLSDFINAVKEKYGIEPTMVVQGVKMLYVPIMPGHAKRLKLTMHKLVKPSTEKKYVDLTVSFAPDTDGDEDLPGPPVRYYFSDDTDE